MLRKWIKRLLTPLIDEILAERREEIEDNLKDEIIRSIQKILSGYS